MCLSSCRISILASQRSRKQGLLRIVELWGGDKPEVSDELGPGKGGQFWDSTSLLECLC